nr:Methyltransferase domain containing protein [Haemonchus contortus]
MSGDVVESLMSSKESYKPEDYEKEFDPDAYLNHYFARESIEDGTRMSLFALPVFAHIMLQSMPPSERETLLDIGAGPTVYTALCFRDTVKTIYLSDFLEKNLDVLRKWRNNDSTYNWKPTIRVIKRTEGGMLLSDAEMNDIEAKARAAVKRGGILYANVHEDPVVPDLNDCQVDIVVSIFTLESACQTYLQYCQCVQNIVKRLRSGGRLVIGSVLGDESYNSGNQVIFSLLSLTEQQIMNALGRAGIDLDSMKKYVLDEDGVIFLMAIKR